MPIGILSFDDELSDGDGFKVKKTSLSERMAKKRDKEKNVTNRHYKVCAGITIFCIIIVYIITVS